VVMRADYIGYYFIVSKFANDRKLQQRTKGDDQGRL